MKKEKPKPFKRLNQFIAQAGICSRRKADTLIQQGLISINGKVVTSLGSKVQLTDTVCYKNRILTTEPQVYILLNKPKNLITTVKDEQGRATVMDLISKYFKERLYPVGRLDRDTTGLLLMTNDGAFSRILTHPSCQVQKIYRLRLNKALSQVDYERIIYKEFVLEDGAIPFDGLNFSVDDYTLDVALHSGRNRVVRRVFEHLGYNVKTLDRIVLGNLTKKGLKRGQWRPLKPFEVVKLKYLNRSTKVKGFSKSLR